MAIFELIFMVFCLFIVRPIIWLIRRILYLPHYIIHKTTLGLAYLWLYINYAPEIIENAFDPDNTDYECWLDFCKLMSMLFSIYLLIILLMNE